MAASQRQQPANLVTQMVLCDEEKAAFLFRLSFGLLQPRSCSVASKTFISREIEFIHYKKGNLSVSVN